MKKKDGMPDVVYLGLLGINSKSVAYGYLLLSLVLALGCLIYGFVKPIFFWGVPMVGAAYWYYYSIKWIDANSTWDK